MIWIDSKLQASEPRMKAVIRNSSKNSKITFDILHPKTVSTLEFPFNNPKPLPFFAGLLFSPQACVWGFFCESFTIHHNHEKCTRGELRAKFTFHSRNCSITLLLFTDIKVLTHGRKEGRGYQCLN